MQIRGTWSAGPGDDQARFLADLRALRDSAAIGYDELAARAHYPSDILKEAENGPYLPGLPILTAYVRACEGDVLDWEERWRRLNPEVAEDPDLPVRPAGASPAAVAGARAGVGVAPPDVYDPERIRAALRGNHGRSGQDGRRANHQGVSALAHGAARSESAEQDLLIDTGASRDGGASWGASSSWDTPPDPGITSANGNHSATHGSRGPFDAAFTVLPDPAEETEPAPDQDFSWLDRADPPLAAQPEAAPEPAVTEQMPRHQADGLTVQERTDFWAKPATSASPSASVAPPAPAPPTEEPTITRTSRPRPCRPGLGPGSPADLQPSRADATGSASPVITPASWPASADTRNDSRLQSPHSGPRPRLAGGRPRRRSRSARPGWPRRPRTAGGMTAVRTGSSRYACWRSSSSPRLSAARWCCCLNNVLARRLGAVGGGRVAVVGRGGYLGFGPGSREHGAEGVGRGGSGTDGGTGLGARAGV